MIKKLYIIGNGFDLFHGIQSSYSNFGEFLEIEAVNVFDNVKKYLMQYDESLWSTFEENLANLDRDTLLEEASEFLVGYGAEDWSDAYHHDYQYEIDQVVSSLSKDLLVWFSAWARQIQIPLLCDYSGDILSLDRSAMFLTFNYTPTLARIYDIPEKQIVYLHGNSSVKQDNLLLGHGWIADEKVIETEDDFENMDTRIQQGDELIDSYFKTTFKSTSTIISSHQNFFQSLKSLESIIVFGHSVSDMDSPYFEEILKNIDVNVVNWEVSYHHDIEPIRHQIENLEIVKSLVEYVRLEDFVY